MFGSAVERRGIRVFNYTNIRICHESDADKDRKKRKEKGSILISNDVMKYGARQAMMDLIMHYARRRSRLGRYTVKTFGRRK